MSFRRSANVIATWVALALTACAVGHEGGLPPIAEPALSERTAAPTSYAFDGAVAGESNVSYSGQTHRHALIEALKTYVGSLTATVDRGDYEAGHAVTGADLFLRYNAAVAEELGHGLSYSMPAKQVRWGELNSKNIIEKIAGNDTLTDHRDWATEFAGWQGASSPEALVDSWVEQLDALAVARAAGSPTLNPISDQPVAGVFITAEGLDLQQLLQKFLLGAVAFHQGTDDYLDDDMEGKGLLTPNVLAEGRSYTQLAHHWDEAFGYFGAARDYAAYSDGEIAAKGGRDTWQGHHDSDDDGNIDLKSEVNFGHSINAAKRDLDSADSALTDFTKTAFEAFIAGRNLIHHAGEKLTEPEMTELVGYRDTIVDAWERVIAATVVHYINECIADRGVAPLNFESHAKHWSELKGFALSLQFSPHSPLSTEGFATLHALIADAPKLPGQEGFRAYTADLLAARVILAEAYGFESANLGDDQGAGGW
jgi:hypothetical protein